MPPNCKQTKLITFFLLVLSFYAILSPTGCLNLKQAWNPNPSRRLNSESSSPCKCCDNRGLRAISMLATASAIRQTRQQELGARDIEEGLYLHFIQEDTSVCIRTRGINVPVLTSYTVNLCIFFLVCFLLLWGHLSVNKPRAERLLGERLICRNLSGGSIKVASCCMRNTLEGPPRGIKCSQLRVYYINKHDRQILSQWRCVQTL